MNQAEQWGYVSSAPQLRSGGAEPTCSFMLGQVFRGKKRHLKVRTWGYRAEWVASNLKKGDRIRVIGPIILPESPGAKLEIEGMEINYLLSRRGAA